MEDPGYPFDPRTGPYRNGLLSGGPTPGGLLGAVMSQPGILQQMANPPTLAQIRDGSADISAPMGLMMGMTGLPGDFASRMARAQQGGFTTRAYKGAYPYDPATVPGRNWRGEVISGADRVPQLITEFNSPGQPFAGFFSDSPAVASRFADAFGDGSRGSTGAVYPVLLRLRAPHTIDAAGRNAREFQFGPNSGLADYLAGRGPLQRLFDNQNIDSVIIRNTADEGTIFIPRSPSQARSVHAMFDPRRFGAGDMLAGSLPFSLLYGQGE